jgi:hypothetical protein
MYKIQPIVEGPGDVQSVPILLRRILGEALGNQQWQVLRPINTEGCGNMTRPGGIERFVLRAQKEPGCNAVTVIIDRDAVEKLPNGQRLPNNCSPTFARWFSQRIQATVPRIPVVVIVAHTEYEAWFLASIETIAGRRNNGLPGLSRNTHYDGDPENHPDPKAWINARLSRGYRYSETRDQENLTKFIDLQIVHRRSRSFRRLIHAVEEIIALTQQGQVSVTPNR